MSYFLTPTIISTKSNKEVRKMLKRPLPPEGQNNICFVLFQTLLGITYLARICFTLSSREIPVLLRAELLSCVITISESCTGLQLEVISRAHTLNRCSLWKKLPNPCIKSSDLILPGNFLQLSHFQIPIFVTKPYRNKIPR